MEKKSGVKVEAGGKKRKEGVAAEQDQTDLGSVMRRKRVDAGQSTESEMRQQPKKTIAAKGVVRGGNPGLKITTATRHRGKGHHSRQGFEERHRRGNSKQKKNWGE